MLFSVFFWPNAVLYNPLPFRGVKGVLCEATLQYAGIRNDKKFIQPTLWVEHKV